MPSFSFQQTKDACEIPASKKPPEQVVLASKIETRSQLQHGDQGGFQLFDGDQRMESSLVITSLGTLYLTSGQAHIMCDTCQLALTCANERQLITGLRTLTHGHLPLQNTCAQVRMLWAKYQAAYWRTPSYNFTRFVTTTLVACVYASVYHSAGSLSSPASIATVSGVTVQHFQNAHRW